MNTCVMCGNECKRRFCSDRCRMQHNRSKANTNTQRSEQTQSEQPKANKPNPVCEQHVLTALDLKHWRGSRPYYLDQDTHLAHLSCEHLLSRLSDMNPWQGSPEYAERVYRLVHGLTALSIPANMVADGYEAA